MKAKIVFLCLFFYSLTGNAQFLYFPPGQRVNPIELGRINVSGQRITLEALITPTKVFPDESIISKGNYKLKIGSFSITTSEGEAVVENPVELCVNKVYHIAGTYDGQFIRYFVNGVQVAATACKGNLKINESAVAIANMRYKSSFFSSDKLQQYCGYVSEVRIWNTARTSAEIKANMFDLPNPTTQKGLLAYYKFNGSLENNQQDARWDGKTGNKEQLTRKNPYFNGTLSYSFCGGETSLVKPPVVVVPAPVPVAAKAPEANKPVRMAVKQQAKPLPPPAQPSPPARAVREAKPLLLRPAKPLPAPEPVKATAPSIITPVVPTARTSIVVWDFDALDGDSISLKINGKQFGPKAILLLAFYISVDEPLVADLPAGQENELEITALSQGSVSLASVGLLISEGGESRRYYTKLKKGENWVLRFGKK